jgi:hypothetical protein
LTAASLLALAVVLILWIRGETGIEEFAPIWHNRSLSLLTTPGRLALTYVDYNQPAYQDFLGQPADFFHYSWHEYIPRFVGLPQRDDYGLYLLAMHFHPWFTWGGPAPFRLLPGLRTHWLRWDWYQDAKYRTQALSAVPWDKLGTYGWGFSMPTYYLAIAFALPGLIRLIPRLRRRFPAGHCQNCGYDLRATPNQCPECGAKTLHQGSSKRLPDKLNTFSPTCTPSATRSPPTPSPTNTYGDSIN